MKTYQKALDDDGSAADVVLSPKDTFRIKTFNVIIDNLITEMEKKRKACYTKLNDMFSFLTDKKLNESELRNKAQQLVEAYPEDLEAEFMEEFVLFSKLSIEEKCV